MAMSVKEVVAREDMRALSGTYVRGPRVNT
jgi:hypothetical protein